MIYNNSSTINENKHVDLIIVGGGLAGCCLAWNAIFKGLSIVIIDNANKNIASNVAPGLFNPITGRTFQKSWKADTLFPFLYTFYKQVENVTKSRFFFQSNILKPFWNKEEYHLCSKSNMLDDDFINIIHPNTKNTSMNFGGIEIKKSGFLDVKKFLNATREFLSRDNTKNIFFVKEDFYYKNVIIKHNIPSISEINSKNVVCDTILPNIGNNSKGSEYIVYKTTAPIIDKKEDRSSPKWFIAKNIVFCEGVYGCFNPFFTNLAFRPVLGEILNIQICKNLKGIYNRDVFIFCKNNKIATIGSTYKRLEYSYSDGLNSPVFNYGRYELSKHTFNKSPESIMSELKTTLCDVEKLNLIHKTNRLLKACGRESLPQADISKKVGIRPCTLNRRPILEIHPKYPNMGILNGLGAKGISLAPYFSEKILNKLFS